MGRGWVRRERRWEGREESRVEIGTRGRGINYEEMHVPFHYLFIFSNGG